MITNPLYRNQIEFLYSDFKHRFYITNNVNDAFKFAKLYKGVMESCVNGWLVRI